MFYTFNGNCRQVTTFNSWTLHCQLWYQIVEKHETILGKLFVKNEPVIPESFGVDQ